MATVNLGRIKPVFRGAFNNSTAYVIDDIVTSGNETFIAIAATQGNATTDASKWTKLAAKGADGTDVAAILANKEIAFKTNAGALDGIPIGTAGQALKVNSGATGYEFGLAGGLVKSVGAVKVNTQTINYNNGRTVISGLNLDFGAVVGSSSKLLIMGCIEYGYSGGDPGASFRWEYSADNSTWYGDKNLSTRQASGGSHAGSDANSNWSGGIFFGGSGVTIPTASVIHSATNQIIAVSALTVTPRYFRVTLRQTDVSNDDININFHDNTGGFAPTGNSTFNVLELSI